MIFLSCNKHNIHNARHHRIYEYLAHCKISSKVNRRHFPEISFSFKYVFTFSLVPRTESIVYVSLSIYRNRVPQFERNAIRIGRTLLLLTAVLNPCPAHPSSQIQTKQGRPLERSINMDETV